MKNILLFLKIGAILMATLLVIQFVYIILINKDLFLFYENPKTLTFVLMVGFRYAFNKCEEYEIEELNKKSKKKPKQDSDL